MKSLIPISLLGLSLLCAWPAQANSPTLDFSARLTGDAVDQDGEADVLITLYDDSDSSDSEHVLWQESQTVQLKNGYFSVDLGSNASNPLPENIHDLVPEVFMGLQVGTDDEMSPRLRVTPSFLAKEALNPKTLQGKTVEDLLAEAAAAQTQAVYGVADEAGLTVTDSNDFGLMTCDAGFVLKAGDAGVWDCAADAVRSDEEIKEVVTGAGFVMESELVEALISEGFVTETALAERLATISFSSLTDVPADLLDGDQDTVYSPDVNGTIEWETTTDPDTGETVNTLSLMSCEAGQILLSDPAGLWTCTPQIDTSEFVTQSDLPDLSAYATNEQIPDVSNFATVDQIPDVSSFISADQLPDVSNFVTVTRSRTLVTLRPPTQSRMSAALQR